jgi:hypothetical protein
MNAETDDGTTLLDAEEPPIVAFVALVNLVRNLP